MLASAVRQFPGADPTREFIRVRNAFLADVHATFDCSLGRFFARRGVARDEIADLTQEVYLRLARQPDVGTIRSARAFVFATATNLLRDRFRRKLTRGYEQHIEAEVAEIPSESADPQKEVECTQQLNLALLAIRSLKPATRRAFLGHRVHGLSYADLAHQLGVSVSMIEKHMISAIATLRPLRPSHDPQGIPQPAGDD